MKRIFNAVEVGKLQKKRKRKDIKSIILAEINNHPHRRRKNHWGFKGEALKDKVSSVPRARDEVPSLKRLGNGDRRANLGYDFSRQFQEQELAFGAIELPH
jgi:hypothetical protein